MPTKKGALCTSIKDMVGTFNEPVLMGEFSGSIVAEEFFSLAHQLSVTGTIMSLYLLERNVICVETRKSDN